MIQLAENAFLRTVPRPRGSQVRRGRSTLSVRQGLVIPRTVELSCRLANDPYGHGIASATVRVCRGCAEKVESRKWKVERQLFLSLCSYRSRVAGMELSGPPRPGN